MSLTCQDALDLKEAGFPQEGRGWMFLEVEGQEEPDEVMGEVTFPQVETKNPTLEELIIACGDITVNLVKYAIRVGEPLCVAWSGENKGIGSSPIQAVKNLYCALNKN